MEALQALKLSSRNHSLNLTEHLSPSLCSLEDELEVCEALEAVYDMESVLPAWHSACIYPSSVYFVPVFLDVDMIIASDNLSWIDLQHCG